MLYHMSYIPLYFFFFYFTSLLFYFLFLAKMHPVGFEPTHLSISVLETDPLDHSGTNASLLLLFSLQLVPAFYFFPFLIFLFSFMTFFLLKMHPVGFEPTHLSIAELKSAPLDHSGTNAFYYITFFLLPLHFLFTFFPFFFCFDFFFFLLCLF